MAKKKKRERKNNHFFSKALQLSFAFVRCPSLRQFPLAFATLFIKIYTRCGRREPCDGRLRDYETLDGMGGGWWVGGEWEGWRRVGWLGRWGGGGEVMEEELFSVVDSFHGRLEGE